MSNWFKVGDTVVWVMGQSRDFHEGYVGAVTAVTKSTIEVDNKLPSNNICWELHKDSEPDGLDDGKKYVKTIYGLCGTPVEIDVYRVLDAYPTGDSALDHAVKKALNAGNRGHKDKITDYKNIEESARKARILLEQKMTHGEQE